MKTILRFAGKNRWFPVLKKHLAGVLICLPVAGLQAQRTLPTTDQFDYNAGPLHIVGLDWTRVSGSGNDLLVTEGNITYNGYLGANGRNAAMTNGATDDLKLSFTGQNNPGTTVYVSFALNVDNITGLSSTGAYCYILGSGTNNFAGRIYIKLSGTGYVLGVSKTATVPSVWSSTLAAGTPQLIVLAYEIQSGTANDIASLWINPPITTIRPDADLTTSTGSDFGGGSFIDGFMLRQATGSPNASIDDIVISTSWGDLLKNPVFISSGSIGEGSFQNLLVTGNPASVNMNGNVSLSGTLTIQSGSALIINPLKTLTVSGNTTLSGTECLVVKSDATGTGSFIDNGIINGTGTAKVERFLTGYTSMTDKKYHFISSPVAGQPIQPEFVANPPNAGDDFYKWDEPASTWINTKNNSGAWNTGFETVVENGKGYLAAYPVDQTKNFSGLPNTNPPGTPLVKTCTRTDPSAGGGGGWNLLGNPYPSAIDWNLVSRGSGIDNALYYYDASVENYRYYIQYQPGMGIGNGSQYIPAMQGFLVHAAGTGVQTVSFDNNSRVHQSMDLYYKDLFSVENMLQIKVENDDRSDELYILFRDEATPEFDGLFDAYKMFSLNPEIPQIYSITPEGNNLAINAECMKEGTVIIPIGFKPGIVGDFRLTAEGTDGFNKHIDITLEDLKTGTTCNLKAGPEYHFTADPADGQVRFRIRFSGMSGTGERTKKGNCRIYGGEGCVHVLMDQNDQSGVIAVYSLSGQEILRGKINGPGLVSVPVDVMPGMYLVKVITEKEIQTEKVLFK